MFAGVAGVDKLDCECECEVGRREFVGVRDIVFVWVCLRERVKGHLCDRVTRGDLRQPSERGRQKTKF